MWMVVGLKTFIFTRSHLKPSIIDIGRESLRVELFMFAQKGLCFFPKKLFKFGRFSFFTNLPPPPPPTQPHQTKWVGARCTVVAQPQRAPPRIPRACVRPSAAAEMYSAFKVNLKEDAPFLAPTDMLVGKEFVSELAWNCSLSTVLPLNNTSLNK